MKGNNNYTMAQTFNFETRELVPYRNDWNRGGNVNVSGALWFIKERDGLLIEHLIVKTFGQI